MTMSIHATIPRAYTARPKRPTPTNELSARYWRGEAKMRPRTLERIWRVWAVYDAIQRRRGLPPSLREVAEVLGFSSWSLVAHSVCMLTKWGVMENTPGKGRARRVLIPFNQWLGD
jgi:hypothetical protein